MPAKVLSPVLGKPVLEHLLARLRRSTMLDEVVLAVPDTRENDPLGRFGEGIALRVVRGSEADVLDRVLHAARTANAAVVVRVTGDCPLVEPTLVDRLVRRLLAENLDWIATGTTFPDGFDVEVCTLAALERAGRDATAPYDREHVMPYVRRHEARHQVVERTRDLSGERVTLDEPEDLEVIRAVYEHFGHDRFTLEHVETLLRERPELFDVNRRLVRNQGATMGTGQKLWERGKRVIPGGSMLLSKRAEMFLPVGWPAYFSRSRGCRVWDLDDREYLDVGLMGVGTNILGYGHPVVDEAVRGAVERGNLATLNAPEEVLLAEKLVELHPWAQMARFTRSGGEACAVAIRVARAASGRDGVAVCGYHGWHDWYLAANLADDEALDGHLLPGLEPKGVPRGLRGTVTPFAYNDLEGLEVILSSGGIGTVMMEVERSTPPAPGFLQGVRDLATRYGVVLVFDECTSGFRKVLGGLHLHYGVEPDLCVLSKTLGNGYGIAAVIGREAVMQAAQSTFVSSTFWTERIGPVAALASLEAMRDEDAPARVDAIGAGVRERWLSLADELGLPITTSGVPALSAYSVTGSDGVAVKTFVTQEMLAAGFLAGPAIYASIAHIPEVVDAYFKALEPVWTHLRDHIADGTLSEALAHGSAQSGFQRLA